MSRWLTRNEIAIAINRQPRWVTDKLIKPRLLSYSKVGKSYLVEQSDFEEFLRKLKIKGRII